MEKDFLQSLENFDRVWLRVRGETPPAAGESCETLLRRRIDGKCAQAAFYAAAAQQGPESALLRLLAGEKRRQARCLQVELFLLTGACHKAAGACPLLGRPLENLRSAWLGEGESARALRTAASECPESMGNILRSLAQEDDRHAAVLRARIKKRILGN